MDGRWKRWACAGLVVGALGCNRNSVQKPPVFPDTQDNTSLLQQAFGDNPKLPPQVSRPEMPAAEVRDPNQPLRPETLCTLADAEVGAAFMEGKPAVERDRLLDSARQKYQQALKTSPHHRGALIGLGELYARSGNQQRAIAAIQEAMQHAPQDHELAHKLAAMQIRFQDWQGAAQSCQQALAIDPENRTYTRTLGYCQAQLNQWQEAGETLMKVMPEAKARYFLGRVMIDQNRTAEGRQMIQMATAMDPELEAAKDFLAELDGADSPRGVMQAEFNGGQPVSER